MANLNNVQNVKFLRNGALFTSREQATSALTNFTLTSEMDGSSILARYQVGTDPIKTLVGYVYYKDASNKSITIFDVDDAGSDVDEKIRAAIEALDAEITSSDGKNVQVKVTEVDGKITAVNITTDNTVNSGDVTTAIENAINDLDGSVVAETGYFVKSVTEADGKISGTTEALPTVAAISQDGKPITAVSESFGAISATAGTINAEFVNIADSGSLITATTVEGALAEIAAEIDGMDLPVVSGDGEVITAVSEEDGKVSASKTAIKDVKLTGYVKDTTATGAISATDDIEDALSKLENKAAAITINDADHSINVTPTTSGTDISVNIKNGEKVLAKGADGVYTELDLVKITTGLPETIKERYQLLATNDSQIGANIDIPKDSHIVSINYITTGEHAQNLEYVYIDVSGNTQTTYVDMSELVLETEFASGVTVTDHVAHGVVDPTSETFLTVGTDGFKVAGVQNAIDSAIEALDATGGTQTIATGKHVAVEVAEVDGKITTVTVVEDNIADADDLAELSAKTVTEIASSNASISAVSSSTADGTVKYDVVTDASKIKMSGFTSTDVLSGITSSSSITEAFEEVDKVITSNEEVVSAALNDLNDKISAETAARKAVDGQNGDTYAANTSANYISTATSLNDADVKLDAALKAADDRIDTVSGDVETIKDKYISGVSVNGNAVTVANNVAPISITPATSAVTATSTEAIVVDTDANGNITLGIANIDCGTY